MNMRYVTIIVLSMFLISGVAIAAPQFITGQTPTNYVSAPIEDHESNGIGDVEAAGAVYAVSIDGEKVHIGNAVTGSVMSGDIEVSNILETISVSLHAENIKSDEISYMNLEISISNLNIDTTGEGSVPDFYYPTASSKDVKSLTWSNIGDSLDYSDVEFYTFNLVESLDDAMGSPDNINDDLTRFENLLIYALQHAISSSNGNEYDIVATDVMQVDMSILFMFKVSFTSMDMYGYPISVSINGYNTIHVTWVKQTPNVSFSAGVNNGGSDSNSGNDDGNSSLPPPNDGDDGETGPPDSGWTTTTIHDDKIKGSIFIDDGTAINTIVSNTGIVILFGGAGLFMLIKRYGDSNVIGSRKKRR